MLSEDNKQILTGTNKFIIEFYKIMCGCFLILFVPQKCGDEFCSITNNYERNDILNKTGLSFNLLSFILFLGLYYIEIRREKCCIYCLDIDPEKSNNNLDDEIEIYPVLKQKLHKLNNQYYFLSLINVCAQLVNIPLSTFVIYQNNFGALSLTPLLSYILLVLTKLYNVYFVSDASLKEERMYSAYLTINRTFNVIDEDYIKKHHNVNIEIIDDLNDEKEDNIIIANNMEDNKL